MAIYLVTGTLGAGKTLNTIQMVHERAKAEGRPVYFANVNGMFEAGGLTFENWHKMPNPNDEGVDLATAVTPHSWQNAPDGSILVIDECQKFFPATSINTKSPSYVLDLAECRHRGFDVYLITQSPHLIDPKIKAWVSPHIHYRRIGGGNSTWRYTNEQVVNNILSVSDLSKAAVKKRVKLNTAYYATYKSASLHTNNRRTNPKLVALLTLPLVVVPLALWYAMHVFTGRSEHVTTPPPRNAQEAVARVSGLPLPPFKQDEEKFNPVLAYVPRVEAMPETAPAYDELRKPQDFPRPQCMASKKRGCQCYSQQGTLLRDYPRDLCRTYVKEGYFDPTRQPRRPTEPQPKAKSREP